MSRRARKEKPFSKQLVPMLIGTLLYAALTIPFSVFQTPIAGGLIAVRPAVAIPMFLGIVFGPATGFVVGLVGNVISDFLSFGGFFWNWEIGYGLLGAIPGIAYFLMKRTDWTKARGLAIAAILAVVAAIIGVGFAVVADYMFQIGTAASGSALIDFYSFAGGYAVNGAIFTPILLYAYARATARHPQEPSRKRRSTHRPFELPRTGLSSAAANEWNSEKGF